MKSLAQSSAPTIALALLCSMAVARAQERTVLAGAGGGYAVGILTGSVPVYEGGADCGVFERGEAFGPWFGGRVWLPGLIAPRLGLAAHLAWEGTAGSLEATPNDAQAARDPRSGDLVTLDRRYRLSARSGLVRLDLLAHYDLAGGWSLGAGPWGGYQTSLETSFSDTILAPGDIGFAGGQRSRSIAGAPRLSSSAISFGFAIACARELPIGRRLLLLPEVSLRAALSSPAREASWRRFSLGAGLALLFDLTPSPAIVEEPIADAGEPAGQIPPPHVPRLHASIEVLGVDESGVSLPAVTVEVNDLLDREYTPLLPAIFFDRGASSIAARYVENPNGRPAEFAIDRLRGAGALAAHRYNLSIVGSRMRSHPDAVLTLYGGTSGDEPASLGVRRAEAVAEHLATVWGIDRSRMIVKEGAGPIKPANEATEDGRMENRRVGLAASDPAILAPLRSDAVSRAFNPPVITMRPAMEAEAGVRRWSILVRHGDEVVARYASDEDSVAEDAGLSWRIADDRIDSIPSSIRVELVVEDSAGASVTARDEVPLAVRHRRSLVERYGKAEVDRTIYTLVGFDYDTDEPRQIDHQLLDLIAGTIAPGSRVTVVGFADRIGGEGYNRELSQRRALRAASMLRRLIAARGLDDVDVTVRGEGVETSRFGGDLPEGRMLTRGVQIIVASPEAGARP